MEIDDIYVDAPRTAQTAEEAVRQRYAEREARETLRREREAAQRKAKEAATQHLIESSLAIIEKETAAAITRLRAENWPKGSLMDVVVGYQPVYSGWLRKRICSYSYVQEERAVWRIALDDTYSDAAYLGSDGEVYFFSEVKIDDRYYNEAYHSIDMPGNAFFIYSDQRKRIRLSDDGIRSRVERTINELRKLGSD
jgi:hypothetical protein